MSSKLEKLVDEGKYDSDFGRITVKSTSVHIDELMASPSVVMALNELLREVWAHNHSVELIEIKGTEESK